MTLQDFCSRISAITGLTNAQKAVAVLWRLDCDDAGCERTAGELARIIRDHHIGNPNSTELAAQVKRTTCVYSRRGRFRLRQEKKAEVRSWFESVLTGVVVQVPETSQFMNEQVWKPTRGYIEKVCVQLNGAYHEGFFDCAAVMVRRVVETLIIEAFESLNRESEIKAGDGNYFMLGDLVNRANGAGGLSLGPEAKKGLEEIRKQGNRSAHNRRYNAKKSDLDKIRDQFRVAFEELANLAGLYPV